MQCQEWRTRGHLRARGPGKWQIVVSLGRHPLSDRYRQLARTVHGTKSDAEQALADLVSEVGKGAYKGTAGTLAGVVERWLDFREDDVGAKTLDTWRQYLAKRISPARVGQLPLHKLTAADLDQFYVALKRNEGLAPATIRQIHSVIRGALKQAVKWGLVDTNVALNATLPRAKASEIRPPEPAEVRQLIDALDAAKPELAVFLWLAAATGARRGELCAVTWSSIEPDALVLARSISVVGERAFEKDTKTHQVRRIALDPVTAAVIKRHRVLMAARAAAGGAALAPGGYVFSDALDGSTFWNPEWVTGTFRRTRKQLQLEHVRLHDLRHLHASRLLALGVDVRTVAGRLGHANAATTLKVYAHFQQVADRMAAEAIGGDLLRPHAGVRARRRRLAGWSAGRADQIVITPDERRHFLVLSRDLPFPLSAPLAPVRGVGTWHRSVEAHAAPEDVADVAWVPRGHQQESGPRADHVVPEDDSIELVLQHHEAEPLVGPAALKLEVAGGGLAVVPATAPKPPQLGSTDVREDKNQDLDPTQEVLDGGLVRKHSCSSEIEDTGHADARATPDSCSRTARWARSGGRRRRRPRKRRHRRPGGLSWGLATGAAALDLTPQLRCLPPELPHFPDQLPVLPFQVIHSRAKPPFLVSVPEVLHKRRWHRDGEAHGGNPPRQTQWPWHRSSGWPDRHGSGQWTPQWGTACQPPSRPAGSYAAGPCRSRPARRTG